MNIRNYLKGIGVGIIVASLVLIIAGKFNNKAMSDEDVIKRAKELGMVESTTLTQPSANNGLANTSDTQVVSDDKNSNQDSANTSDTDSKDNSDSKTGDDKSVNASDTDSKSNTDSKTADDKTANTSDTDSKTSDDKSADSNSDNADKTSNAADKTVKSTDTVSVEVKSGMSSESAAAAVKDAGLVDDDIEFNKYLCANGYDKRLRVGQYDIPKGSRE